MPIDTKAIAEVHAVSMAIAPNFNVPWQQNACQAAFQAQLIFGESLNFSFLPDALNPLMVAPIVSTIERFAVEVRVPWAPSAFSTMRNCGVFYPVQPPRATRFF
jgi:hypothetical protein